MVVLRLRRHIALAGVAGVVLAHAIDYLALFPDVAGRNRILASTGHAYWPTAAVLAGLGATGALAGALLRGARRPPGERSHVAGWRVFAGLAAWQALLFSLLELSERTAVGIPASTLLHSAEFGVGLLLQVTVAGVVLLALRGAEGLGQCLRARGRRSLPRSPTRVLPPVSGPAPSGRIAARPAEPRAPPTLALI